MAWLRWYMLIATFLLTSACGNAPTTVSPGASVTVGSSSASTVARSAPTSTPLVPEASEALTRDAEQYAKMFGVDLSEAIRRLQLQDSIGALQQTLTEREAAFFGGLWIEHTPQYRVVVHMTEGGYDAVSPYVEGTPLADVVKVREADATLRELEAAHTETMRILDQANVTAPSQLTVQKNRVEVIVYDREEVETKLRQAGVRLPPLVDLIADPSSRPPMPEETTQTTTSSSGVQFFRQTPVDGPRDYPAAEIRGTLSVDDGCLRIVSVENNSSIVPIWPVDYTMIEDRGVVTIRDGAGQEVGRVGEDVYLGGGEIPEGAWSELSGLPSKPSTCPGPYWLVSPL